MPDVFLTAAGAFLPGPPIPNSEMLDYIGEIDARSTKLGRLVLRQNRIRTRHYAITPAGKVAHSNAAMAAAAVRNAVDHSELSLSDLDFLGTATQGDLLVPGHASAVHAELSLPPLEIASFQSVCASSLMAAKTAYLHVKGGDKQAAAVVGSEFSSRWFQPGFYREVASFLGSDETRMAGEFLRWTLSDGAGALLFEPRPNERSASFKIEWIDLVSLADRFDPCMYAGITPENRADLDRAWSHYASPAAAADSGAIMLLQDFALLKEIIRAWVGRYLDLVDQERIVPNQVDWLLCHYSAQSLREEIVAIMESTGGMIPEERWFTNLPSKGNTGSASLFIMLEEFIEKRLAKSGDRILCIVPESGRAIVAFMMLTAL